jgi:hypothetical protein
MLLREMFSPLGGPKEEENPNINWLEDLKFYIDNEDDMLLKHIFPAVKKHEGYVGHPDAYKLYIHPVDKCCEDYCHKFDITDRGDKFPKEDIIKLAQKFCEEQEKHIKDGHYKSDEN